jgi:hypothetical protein
MEKKERKIKLPEGTFDARLQFFCEDDRKYLLKIYNLWRSLSELTSEAESRTINIPEVLSEGLIALEFDAPRLLSLASGANSSFDCYSIDTEERIQVKACSVIPDLTSFGPRSVWDRLYFCDFYRNGEWDGQVDIYEIPNELIYVQKVNRNQTFRDQQNQNRRPRFSIYKEIIDKHKLKPAKTATLR